MPSQHRRRTRTRTRRTSTRRKNRNLFSIKRNKLTYNLGNNTKNKLNKSKKSKKSKIMTARMAGMINGEPYSGFMPEGELAPVDTSEAMDNGREVTRTRMRDRERRLEEERDMDQVQARVEASDRANQETVRNMVRQLMQEVREGGNRTMLTLMGTRLGRVAIYKKRLVEGESLMLSKADYQRRIAYFETYERLMSERRGRTLEEVERLANEAGELAARVSRIESFNSIMASTRAARDEMLEAHRYYMIDKGNNVRPGNVWQIE
jgi:hypothetical protein